MQNSFAPEISSLNPDFINVQINNVDSYTASPTILDAKHGKSLPTLPFVHVPIVRVYGSLPTGHKILVHIHGTFPYIFTEYDGSSTDSLSKIRQNCSKLHELLESRISDIYTKEKNDSKLRSVKYVANVSVVSGVPFYGYHVGLTAFYKITMLSASYCNKISDLIRDGKVFKKRCDVYEAHIPFLLQMMADYNLFGCSWLKLSSCYFRQPVLLTDLDMHHLLNSLPLQQFLKKFMNRNTNVLDTDPFARIGNSILEIDILPQFISNREDIQFQELHHDFRESSLYQDLSQTGYVQSTKEIWNDIQEIRKQKGMKSYVQPEIIVRDSSLRYDWEKDESLLEYFKEAKRRMIPGRQQQLEASTLTESPKMHKFFPYPKEALGELWPRIPRNIRTKIINWSQMAISGPQDNNSLKSGSSENILHPNNTASLGETGVIPSTFGHDSNSFGSSKQQTFKRRKTCGMFQQEATLPRKRYPINKLSALKPLFLPYKKAPVSFGNIKQDIYDAGLAETQYKDPFFSNPVDCRRSQTEYAGSLFTFTSDHIIQSEGVQFKNASVRLPTSQKVYQRSRWRYIRSKPTYEEVSSSKNTIISKFSVLSDLSQKNRYGYKFATNAFKSQNNTSKVMTHLSMELHINTRADKNPDPKFDSISMVFWKIEDAPFLFELDIAKEGILVFLPSPQKSRKWLDASDDIHISFYEDELEMIYALEDLVKFFDPDILSGYEIHSSSWGYLIDRCRKGLKHDFEEEISRVNFKHASKRNDKWGYTHSSGLSITGRHMLNIWRPLRSALNLLDYTIENIAFHVLHHRIPFFSFMTRTSLFNSGIITSLKCLIYYYLKRLRINFQLLDSQNIIVKMMEQARLIGIDFYSVTSRGSQYKVESFLIRLCKSEHFIVLAPSKLQVKEQRALECIPLVMEPSSAFYKCPLLVLDFQSLYPSIMMAYNYCYSTILGRVQSLSSSNNEIGVTRINIPPNLMAVISEYVTISPNGIVFVNKKVRKSVLAKMLKDILDARFLVKQTIKDLNSREDYDLQNMLENRQLALKLLANVTYGYTSASFSGRMPCSDIADSIVQTGRVTLERAIDAIESNQEWGGKVVYGDTDSLFVYLPGKSREDAFKIGKEIASEITKQNPDPVQLKFEKVYHPCFLVTKKRYVGYSYEHESQGSPNFDAKGIETVRRDGTPGQQKIVEKALKKLFDTADLSHVKEYLQTEFSKIISGKVNIKDFCFAREVKLGSYKSEKTAPPGAHVAMKMMEDDARKEPQYKERVPYVVKMGKIGEPLRSRCISPEAYLRSKDARLDSEYYIIKTLIPPLQRFFQLLGVDINDWYRSMPRPNQSLMSSDFDEAKSLHAIVKRKSCLRCNKEVHPNHVTCICDTCRSDRSSTILAFQERLRSKQSKINSVLKVCQTCTFSLHHDAFAPLDSIALACQSKDCPVYFDRVKHTKGLRDIEMKELLMALVDLDY